MISFALPKRLFPRLFLTNRNIRSLHTYIYSMNKAYLRHAKAGDKFDFTFQFSNQQFNVDRNFNFTRSFDENVSTFLTRVTTNIEKIIVKSNKKARQKLKKETGEEWEAPPINISLHMNEAKIEDNVVCKQIFSEPKNRVLLKLLDKEYEIVINPPFVENIALPSTIIANFPVHPLKFETVFVNEQRSSFTWYTSLDKQMWNVVGQGYFFTPDKETANHYLKLSCLPVNDTHEGPVMEVISDNVILPSPGVCPFEKRQKDLETLDDNEFRVVTYNILADLYCDTEFTRTALHPYCPPSALALEYRKALYIKEIMGYNSDIICLQEVDKKVYTHDLEPILKRLDYGSEFAIKGGNVAEGLACFYNKDKFKCLDSVKILLAEASAENDGCKDIWKAINNNKQLMERFIVRQTVTQIVTLECLQSRNIVLVANTHLYFHPNADHIRLLQGAMSIKCVESHYNKTKATLKGRKIAIVFCGDFNSTPDCGIYKLFTSGSVPSDFKDWSSNKEEMVEELTLAQPFKLGSACGTPEYTNYTVGFADCLDYIYYNMETLEVLSSVPMPTNDELIENTALPSVVFPSDHISLCADFQWKKS